ncbi:MAG: hypothetical protein LBD90_08835 [Bifidobacteriaceae bacterium]|jgi:N-acetylglucosamine kinase-like BadF-type ATPase|nr:hypothetical protein [Bifidobacteriaceae bacterium]
MTGWVLGVDAGGTRTTAALADPTGQVVASGKAGTGNFDHVGLDAMRQAILSAAQMARDAAAYRGELAAAFFGVAGVTAPDDRSAVTAALQDMAGKVQADHDCRVALAGGLAGEPGIALIAGTGSACYGRRADGVSFRAGGWGSIAGDEGSAYWLGVAALRLAVRSHDGRGEKSLLEESVKQHLGIGAYDELLTRLHRPQMSRADLAALAPLVTTAAAAGDRAACDELSRAGHDLADCVSAVANRLGWDSTPVRVALIGGLFGEAAGLRGHLQAALAQKLPQARPVDPAMTPAAGACLLARQLITG